MTISTKLCQAAFDGDVEAASELLALGANIDQSGDGWNPLHAAIENEKPHVVRLLLEHGADKERINSGMTPLAHAVEAECDSALQQGRSFDSSSLDLIGLLVGFGCDREPGLAVAADQRNDRIRRFIAKQRAAEQVEDADAG